MTSLLLMLPTKRWDGIEVGSFRTRTMFFLIFFLGTLILFEILCNTDDPNGPDRHNRLRPVDVTAKFDGTYLGIDDQSFTDILHGA